MCAHHYPRLVQGVSVAGVDLGWKTMCYAIGQLTPLNKTLSVHFVTSNLMDCFPGLRNLRELQQDPVLCGHAVKSSLNTHLPYGAFATYVENQHASPQKELLYSFCAAMKATPHREIQRLKVIHPATVKSMVFRPWEKDHPEFPTRFKNPQGHAYNKQVARAWLSEMSDTHQKKIGVFDRGVEWTDHEADALATLLVGLHLHPIWTDGSFSLDGYQLRIALATHPYQWCAQWPIQLLTNNSSSSKSPTIKVDISSSKGSSPITIMDTEMEEAEEEAEITVITDSPPMHRS